MYLAPIVRDSGLSYLHTNGTRLDLCSSEPKSYADVLLYTMGNCVALVIDAPSTRPLGGRQVVVEAILAGGIATVTGVPNWYAITNPTGTELLVVNALVIPVNLQAGDPFSTSAFNIAMPTEVSS